MSEITKTDQHALKSLMYLQLAFDELEAIKTNVAPFIQERKKRLNQFIKFLEPICIGFTDDLQSEGNRLYVEILSKLQETCNEVLNELKVEVVD